MSAAEGKPTVNQSALVLVFACAPLPAPWIHDTHTLRLDKTSRPFERCCPNVNASHVKSPNLCECHNRHSMAIFPVILVSMKCPVQKPSNVQNPSYRRGGAT